MAERARDRAREHQLNIGHGQSGFGLRSNPGIEIHFALRVFSENYFGTLERLRYQAAFSEDSNETSACRGDAGLGVRLCRVQPCRC